VETEERRGGLVGLGEGFTAGDSQINPLVLVCPGDGVSKNLRFTTATLTPEKGASVLSLVSLCHGAFTLVSRSPVMLTEFMVAL